MVSKQNQTQFSDISARTAAIVAGLGLLAMAILAPIANFGALEQLVVTNDAKATVENITASMGLFRMGIVLLLLVAVLDVLVAWGLYVLLEPVSKSLALLMAWFRLAYSAVFALALVPLLGVVGMLEGGLEASQLQTQVMLSLEGFHNGWDIGLVLFGFHLLVLGYIAVMTGFIPKWLGVLLLIAGLGYLVDSFGRFLVADYTFSVSAFTFVGEVVLIFWLLWKGFAARAEAQLGGVRQ
jgi:hypothetical protein